MRDLKVVAVTKMDKKFSMKVFKCDCGQGEKVLLFETNSKRIVKIGTEIEVGRNCNSCGKREIDYNEIIKLKNDTENQQQNTALF